MICNHSVSRQVWPVHPSHCNKRETYRIIQQGITFLFTFPEINGFRRIDSTKVPVERILMMRSLDAIHSRKRSKLIEGTEQVRSAEQRLFLRSSTCYNTTSRITTAGHVQNSRVISLLFQLCTCIQAINVLYLYYSLFATLHRFWQTDFALIEHCLTHHIRIIRKGIISSILCHISAFIDNMYGIAKLFYT